MCRRHSWSGLLAANRLRHLGDEQRSHRFASRLSSILQRTRLLHKSLFDRISSGLFGYICPCRLDALRTQEGR